jgi:hypothetical protein
MDLTARLRTALHETAHAAYASHCGFIVDSVNVSPGETLMQLPFETWGLVVHYRRDPPKALHNLINIVGVIVAPGDVLGVPTTGGDLDRLGEFRQAWEEARLLTTPAGPQWGDVCARAHKAVQQWYEGAGSKCTLWLQSWHKDALLAPKPGENCWKHIWHLARRYVSQPLAASNFCARSTYHHVQPIGAAMETSPCHTSRGNWRQ